MKRRLARLVQLVLLVVAVIGAWRAFQLQSQIAALKSEFDRLTQKFGDMEITDPNLVHIRAIPTTLPLHFAWQVYLPANAALTKSIKTGGSSSTSTSSSSQSARFIAHLRIYASKDGVPSIYSKWSNSSSLSSFGNRELISLLNRNRQELSIEIAGKEQTLVAKAGQLVTMLKINLPPELVEQDPSLANDRYIKSLLPTILRFEVQ